jgi:outer membrane protease
MNVLTGADYYITDKIYLGVELGFGFQYEGRGGSSVVWENPENSSETDSDEIGNSSNFQWGPNYQATIRLGYCLKNKD